MQWHDQISILKRIPWALDGEQVGWWYWIRVERPVRQILHLTRLEMTVVVLAEAVEIEESRWLQGIYREQRQQGNTTFCIWHLREASWV